MSKPIVFVYSRHHCRDSFVLAMFAVLHRWPDSNMVAPSNAAATHHAWLNAWPSNERVSCTWVGPVHGCHLDRAIRGKPEIVA